MPNASADTFDDVRNRLDEIVEAVNAPGISLDEALSLYGEAVKLGLAACDLSEEGAEELVAEEEAKEAAEKEAARAEDGAGETAAHEGAAADEPDSGETRSTDVE